MKDIIIIGGGPIGLNCAIEAKKKGLDYLILEKGALVNSIYNYPLQMTFFSTAERLEIGDIPFPCISPKPGRKEALEYYRSVTQYFGIAIKLYEEVTGIEEVEYKLFKVITNKSSYCCKQVIIATGFYDIPSLLQVPGEELSKVHHYYKEPHPYAFQQVIVVGASNSSVDAALETWRKGAEVTMVIRGNQIGERVKYWVRPDIENRIAEGSIKALFNSNIQEIRTGAVDILGPGGLLTLKNDYVLALTGYQPDFSFLKAIGISLSSDGLMKPSYDPVTMESNIPGLYLAGVVCGGTETHKWFIENSRIHARQIIEHIAAN